MNDCLIPTPRSSNDNRWMSQHTRQIHECKEAEPEVLLIGDSIIQKMAYFDKFWSEVSGLHPLNLGIGGDRIQNLLWRILNGSLNEIQPKAIVLHIGTNCIGNTPEEISDGIIQVVDELHKIFPSAYLIIWGLLPRGEFPNLLRDRNIKVNEIILQHFNTHPMVEVICTGDTLLQSDDRINRKDMYDYLHLTEQGYVKTFTPVLKRLKEILKS